MRGQVKFIKRENMFIEYSMSGYYDLMRGKIIAFIPHVIGGVSKEDKRRGLVCQFMIGGGRCERIA